MTIEDRIAKLERELAELKAAQAPSQTAEERERENAEWRDKMHQLREKQANSFRFSPDIQRAMNAACSIHDLHDLERASHAPKGPSAQGVIPSSQSVVGVHPGGGMAGDGRGWAIQRDFGESGRHPTPGVAAADRIADEFARRDRAELAKRLARQKE